MFDVNGIIIPLITPYDENGKVDSSAAKALMDHFIGKGIEGFYIGGSSGECYLQTQEERKEFLKAVADANGGRAKLMAHIGAISTPNTIELGQYCETLGYDAVSSTPPFYYGFSKAMVRGFYKDVVDAVNLPMCLYNAPGVTGVSFSIDELDEMLSWDNVFGIKHTTTEMTVIERLKKKWPNKKIYHGEDYMLATGALMGADGGIGSTYNVMPEKYLALWNCVEAKDFAGAVEIQKEINDVIDIILKPGFLAGIKGFLTLQGLQVGEPRAPFTQLTDADWEMLKKAMVDYKL
ncbi:N-acetylneuraminate lyase [Reinekea sp.]|jgi:N-acetylneuraminate lyase|uniref:N-acetylneuraminate lyase n=1 Tax=Reinekea sp. TaxID=1970455 RepID=UPI00398A184D